MNPPQNDISGIPAASSIAIQPSALALQQQHVTIPTMANTLTGIPTPPSSSTAQTLSAFSVPVTQNPLAQPPIIHDLQKKQEQQLQRVQHQTQNHPQLLLQQQQAEQLRLQEQQARMQADQLRAQQQQLQSNSQQGITSASEQQVSHSPFY